MKKINVEEDNNVYYLGKVIKVIVVSSYVFFKT